MTCHALPSLSYDLKRLTSRFLSVSTLWIGVVTVSACGGGGGGGGATSSSDVAHRLVAQKSYPAALAVRVTSATMNLDTQGVERVGGPRVAPETRFALGSLTKSITATLAGILVQEGRLSWNSRLLDVLPELAAAARAEYAEVTLRDLLAHRGGIAAITTAEAAAALPELTGTPREQRAKFAAWAVAQRPAVTPHVQTQYSNGGYAAAAAMMERVMNTDYESLAQSRLFDSVGIQPVFGPAGANPAEAWGHLATASGWSPLDPADTGDRPAADPFEGAKLSGRELGLYLQMHLRALRGERGLVITPETARVLHTPVQDGYALGWVVGIDRAQRSVTWHNGSDDTSYYALAAVSEVCDCAVAVLVNAFGPTVAADANDGVLDLLGP